MKSTEVRPGVNLAVVLEPPVSSETKPQGKTCWAFRGLLGGVALGAVFGLLTKDVWADGPYRGQISAAFWGLLSGVLVLLTGFVHHLIQRRRS